MGLGVFVLTCCWAVVTGGTCWLQVGNNGRCQGYEASRMSFDECCGRGVGQVSAGWSSHQDPNPGQVFYWQALSGGAPLCQPCRENCDDVQCGRGKSCRMRKSRPRCVCDPDCSISKVRHHGAICGTNRETFRNHCSLLKHNCRHSAQVEIDYFGSCQGSCSLTECESGQHCIIDQHGLPHCVVCAPSCPEPTDATGELCASDGQTYPSYCHLQRATCLHGRTIGAAYPGPCREGVTCANLTCSWGQQCLTHPATHRPSCVRCSSPCSEVGELPVCGSDGLTHQTWCGMRETACQTGLVIETLHSGPCSADPLGSEDSQPAGTNP